MAQGKMKVKSKLPANAKKRSKIKKSNPVIKKGLYIKPKKAQHVEAEKLKKSLEKSINSNIETQLRSRAISQEGKSFRVQPSSSTKSSDVTKASKKK